MKKKRYASAILCLIGFVMCIVAGTFATVSAEERKASLTLNCVKDGTVIPGMEWELYYVAKIEKEGDKPQLVGRFNRYSYNISLGDNSSSAYAALADTLYTYVKYVDKRFEPTASGVSDENGVVSFTDLDSGLYLLTADKVKNDVYAWETQPMLITLGAGEEYEVNSYPKIDYITLDQSEADYTVRKVWENDENHLPLRSTYITVDLYCNEELADTVRLDESNDWSYTWTDKLSNDWVVVEREIPDNYTVTYRKQLVEYVIVNTYQRPEDSSWITDQNWEETTTPGDSATDIVTTVETSKLQTDETTTTTTPTTATATTTTTTTKTGSGSYSGGNTSSSRNSSGSGSSGGSASNSYKANTPSGNTGNNNVATITKLPQTGQLWWPVLPLAAGGVLMIGFGLKLNTKDERTDE